MGMVVIDGKNGGPMKKYAVQLNIYYELVKEGNKNVKFEKDGHIYRNEQGVKVPSFSEVMDFVKKTYRDDTVIEGMERGSYIHKGMQMLSNGKKINYDSLVDETQEPIRGWQKFIEDENILDYERIVEQPFISKWGFTGTPDLILPNYPGKDQLWLIYLKKDGTYKKQVVAIDKAVFHKFKCSVVSYNWGKEL